MPLLGYNKAGVVAEVTPSADGSLTITDKAAIPGGVVCATSAGDDVLYYIPAATPSVLQRLRFKADKGEFVQDLVRPHKALFFHRNKVFCVPASDSGVAVYDPLCNVVEVLPIPYAIKWAVPADHGFVLHTSCSKTFGYHFNRGLTAVKHGGQVSACVGHYKRYAVVRMRDGDQDVVTGLTETGEAVPLPAALPAVPFTEANDVVLHMDGNDVVSAAGRRVTSHAGPLELTSSPASEEEVLCTICLCEFDGDDGVTLDCGHVFHNECIGQWVSTWMDFAAKGEHVLFTHAVCPSGCKCLIRHPLLPQSRRIATLFLEVTDKKAAQLRSAEATKTDEDLLYYLCGRCGNAFYGGERVCSRMQGREPSSPPQDLVCDDCLAAEHAGGSSDAFIPIFKCRYCCNPATQRSFGTRYLCERCNARWDTAEPSPLPCLGPEHCPFDAQHGDSGAAYVGCLLCFLNAKADHIFDRVAAKEDDDAAKATA